MLHDVAADLRADLHQDGEATGAEPESFEAVWSMRPIEMLPALRAAKRQGRHPRRLRPRRRVHWRWMLRRRQMRVVWRRLPQIMRSEGSHDKSTNPKATIPKARSGRFVLGLGVGPRELITRFDRQV